MGLAERSYHDRFIGKNSTAIGDWQGFLKNRDPMEPVSLERHPLRFDSVVDFPFPTPPSLDKSRIFWSSFLSFNHEGTALLEQLLIFSTRRIYRRVKAFSIHKLCLEEFYHLKGFRKFMIRDRFLLRSQSFPRRVLTQILKIEPFSILLGGTKLEIYSTQFSAMVLTLCEGKPEFSAIQKLHQTHLRDEMSHIPYNYDLFNEVFDSRGTLGRLQLVFYSFAFHMGIQWVFFGGWFRLMKHAFPDLGFWSRLRLGVKAIRWGVREFHPYRATRLILKRRYERHRLRARVFFSYMHW